jgi:sulfur-oxidizing protein SoxX
MDPNHNLTLRSDRRSRLEGWATGAVSVAYPSRRRGACPEERGAPPQDEGFGLTRTLLVLAAALTCWTGAVRAQTVVGDAISTSLTGSPGDAARGRAIVADRQVGLCLLCHTAPIAEERFQGNLAPSLARAGSRWSEGQLRLRIVDASRLNADTIMPPYYRTDGLQRVAKSFSGKTVLSAGQIEDVVAYLASLKD